MSMHTQKITLSNEWKKRRKHKLKVLKRNNINDALKLVWTIFRMFFFLVFTYGTYIFSFSAKSVFFSARFIFGLIFCPPSIGVWCTFICLFIEILRFVFFISFVLFVAHSLWHDAFLGIHTMRSRSIWVNENQADKKKNRWERERAELTRIRNDETMSKHWYRILTAKPNDEKKNRLGVFDASETDQWADKQQWLIY